MHYILRVAFLHGQCLWHTHHPLVLPAWVRLRETDNRLWLLMKSGLRHGLASHSSADHIQYTPYPASHQVLSIRPEHVHMDVVLDFTLEVAVHALTPISQTTRSSLFPALQASQASHLFVQCILHPVHKTAMLAGEYDSAVLCVTVLQWLWVGNKDQVQVDFYGRACRSQAGFTKYFSCCCACPYVLCHMRPELPPRVQHRQITHGG